MTASPARRRTSTRRSGDRATAEPRPTTGQRARPTTRRGTTDAGDPAADPASAAVAAPTPTPSRKGRRQPTRPQLRLIRGGLEQGITTAEYAVGAAAGAGLAGLLYTMLTGGFGHHLLTLLFDHVLALLGIG